MSFGTLSSAFLISMTAAQASPGQPDALRTTPASTPIDPFLPEPLRPPVALASQAELDPRRGTENALAILRAEKARRAGNQTESISLDLRIAALTLRKRFLASTQFTEPERYEQALSTFSRLDLAEPDLAVWLDRTLDHHPEAKKTFGKRSTWKLRAALLTRSNAIDRDAMTRAFTEAFARIGVRFEVVPAREAPVVLTVGAEDVPRPAEGDHAVKVTLGLESIQDKKTVWSHSIFRVEAAKDYPVALKSGLEWIARIGGRDLFFRWLGEHAFPLLLDPTPRSAPRDPHGHDAGGNVLGTTPHAPTVGGAQKPPIKAQPPKRGPRAHPSLGPTR